MDEAQSFQKSLIVFDILNREVFVILFLPNRLIQINQDNTEMNLNKFYITQKSPQKNPYLVIWKALEIYKTRTKFYLA